MATAEEGQGAQLVTGGGTLRPQHKVECLGASSGSVVEANAETTVTWVTAPGRRPPGRHSSPGPCGWTLAKGLRPGLVVGRTRRSQDWTGTKEKGLRMRDQEIPIKGGDP